MLSNLALDGTPDDLILKPDGGELYIPSSSAHGLLIVNTQTNEVGDFLLLGMSPGAAALSEDVQTLWISDSAAEHVLRVAIQTRQIIPPGPIAVGQAPRTCALTPGGDMLLVVDTASNDLAVIRTKTLPANSLVMSPPQSPITLIPVGSRPRDLALKVF